MTFNIFTNIAFNWHSELIAQRLIFAPVFGGLPYCWQWIGYGCLMFFYLCKLAHKLQELVHVHVSA